MSSLTVEERLNRTTSKLSVLAYLFNNTRTDNGLSTTAASGLGMILEEIIEDLEPLTEAPLRVLNWEPGDSAKGR